MSYSLITKKVLEQAKKEAQDCYSPRIEPEHLFIAMCKLYCTTDVDKTDSEIRILQNFFLAGNISPPALAKHLTVHMQHNKRAINSTQINPSKRCEEVIKCAAQERQETCVRIEHLLIPLFVDLCNNIIFRNIVNGIGGNIVKMRENLGLSPNSSSTKMANLGILTDLSTRDNSKKPGDTHISTSDNSVGSSCSNLILKFKFTLAEKAMQEKKWTVAIKQYEEVLKESPNVSPAWNNLGVAYMRTKQYDKSKQAFLNAIHYDSKNADSYANLGILLARDMNRPIEGEKYLIEALNIKPEHECSMYLQSLKRKEKTFTFRQPKIGQTPGSKFLILPVDKQMQADQLERIGKYTEALAIYEEFLKINPSSIQVLNNAATLYIQLRNPSKACQLLEKAIRLDPSYIKAWNNLGLAKTILGDINSAKAAYENVLKYDPGNRVAKHNLQTLITKDSRNARTMYPPVATPINRTPNSKSSIPVPPKPKFDHILKKHLSKNENNTMKKMRAFQGKSLGPAKECLANCINCNKPIIFLLPEKPIRGQRAQIVYRHQCFDCKKNIDATTSTTGKAVLAEECSIVNNQMQYKRPVELIIENAGGLSFQGTRLKPTPLVVAKGKDGKMALLSPSDLL